ncbi:PadR family transcriptional regulator [Paenibacillus sp. strain BS8-2]
MSEQWKQEERLFLHLGNERETGGSGKRYFSRGGVKYALLELLEQENMHGYQMMKALEEQSGGTYKPSAGSIYPTLQMLRDQGLVHAYKQDGKKIFEITDDGRVYLQEEKEKPESPESGDQSCESRESNGGEDESGQWGGARRNRRLTPAGKELLHLLKAAERTALTDITKAAQLRLLLTNLRRALLEITEEDNGGIGEGEQE